MAILISGNYFDSDGQSTYNYTLGSGINTSPLTIACWFNRTSQPGTTSDAPLVTLCSTGGVNTLSLIAANNLGSVGLAGYYTTAGNPTAISATSSSATYALNTWNHVCGISHSSSYRTVFLNAGSSGAQAGARNTTGLNEILIGASKSGISTFLGTIPTSNNTFSGYIAEVAVWNAILTSGEVYSLYVGMSPQLVRPQSLKFYAPGIRNAKDLLGNTLTGNVVTAKNHPRVYGR